MFLALREMRGAPWRFTLLTARSSIERMAPVSMPWPSGADDDWRNTNPPVHGRTRLMVQLAALIACHALGEYRVMLGAALNVGGDADRSEGDRLTSRPVRRHGKGLRLPPGHERRPHRTGRHPVARGTNHYDA